MSPSTPIIRGRENTKGPHGWRLTDRPSILEGRGSRGGNGFILTSWSIGRYCGMLVAGKGIAGKYLSVLQNPRPKKQGRVY